MIKHATSRMSRAAAFTLIELMISIAMVLALMIGVNYVFSSVGQATGLTQAVSRVTREMQGAQSIMTRDFGTADRINAPFIVIRSSVTPAFRNRTDYDTAINQVDPLADVDPVTGNPFPHSLTSVNDRVHRTDVLMFFSRDKFARQTGGGTFNGSTQIQPYLGDMYGQEAMIWYGHLWLPDDTGAFPIVGPSLSFPTNPPTFPGFGTIQTNPNNFLANQWFLGRVAMILQEPDATGQIITKRSIKDASGNPTGAYNETSHWHIKEVGGPVSHALQWNAVSVPTGYTLEQSRFDLAATSMGQLKARMESTSIVMTPWWDRLMSIHRFRARPFVLGAAGSRLSPADLALQSPIFLSNCSQYIVEYAGDFITQDNAGNPTLDQPDGTMDFFPLPGPGQQRRVRWYGFPRDADGDGDIKAADGDVVPLRDVRGSQARFERENLDTILPRPTDTQKDYASPLNPPLPASTRYVCAWGQGPGEDIRPQMFRILVAVDDPNGRFTEAKMFEYVFKLP